MLHTKVQHNIQRLRPDFTSNLVCGLAFRTPKIYIAPHSKINLELVNLGYNCDVESGPSGSGEEVESNPFAIFSNCSYHVLSSWFNFTILESFRLVMLHKKFENHGAVLSE